MGYWRTEMLLEADGVLQERIRYVAHGHFLENVVRQMHLQAALKQLRFFL